MNNMNLCPEVLAFVSKDNGISQNDVKTLYAKMVEDTKKAMEGMTYADLQQQNKQKTKKTNKTNKNDWSTIKERSLETHS